MIGLLDERTFSAIFSNSSGSPVTATTAAVTDFEKICAALSSGRVLTPAQCRARELVQARSGSAGVLRGHKHRQTAFAKACLEDAAAEAEDVSLLIVRPLQHHLRCHVQE